MRGIERSSHKGIISAFGEEFIKSGQMERRFHEYLREAFDARCLSDYFSSPSPLDVRADEVLANAKMFVEVCKELTR